jgi:hypothetical protein
MTRVSQRDDTDKLVWTGTTIASPGGPHFCQQMACTLGAIDRFAHPGPPEEAQLPWRKALARDR